MKQTFKEYGYIFCSVLQLLVHLKLFQNEKLKIKKNTRYMKSDIFQKFR